MTDHTPALTDAISDHALASRWNRIAAAESYDEMREMFFMEVRALLAAAPAAQPDHFGDVNKVVPTAPAAQPATENSDTAFDNWYAAQRHQLTNEKVCRLIWTRGWQAALAAQAVDHQELDGTDAAHPAWWRGSDYTVERLCDQIEKLLANEPVVGHAQARWQRIRERIAALVTQTATPQGQEPIGWISVKDRLPVPGQRIHGLSDAHAWIETFDPNEPLGRMTHWKPHEETPESAPSAGETE